MWFILLKAIIQLAATFYLIIFMIGGGRICGCELLALVGHSHEHHHDTCCSDHHHENHCSHNSDETSDDDHSPDCCEWLKPIEADLPKSLEVSYTATIDAAGGFANKLVFSAPQSDSVIMRWYYPPPDDDWIDPHFSLSALQRFLV